MTAPIIIKDDSSPINFCDSSLAKVIKTRPKFDVFSDFQLRFYKAFGSFRSFEICSIEAFKFTEGKTGNFVNYIIHVKTRDVDFMINRRYSEFNELYNEILKNHREISICNFPEKKWFGNLEETVIKERVIKLNEFLKQLVLNCQKFEFYEVLNFLALDNVYEYFEYDLKTFSFDKVKIHAANKDDELMLDLLIKLNLNNSNLSKTFEEFEYFLFEKKIVISSKIVQILLLGDQDLKGLLELCGSKEENKAHFACNSGLKFLCALMNHENNPGAENFVRVFVGCHIKQLGELNLASHILLTPAKKCKNYALMLLKIYLDGNPNVSNYLIETLLESQEAFNEYQKWKKTHNIFSQRTEGFFVETSSEVICNPRACEIFEEINFFSATFKKIRSPLFRKKANSSFKSRTSSLFKREAENGKKS